MKKLLLIVFCFSSAISSFAQYAYPSSQAAGNPFLHPKDIAGNREVVLIYDEKSPSNTYLTNHKFFDVNALNAQDYNPLIALQTNFPNYDGLQSYGNRHIASAAGKFNDDNREDYVVALEETGHHIALRTYNAQVLGGTFSVIPQGTGEDMGNLNSSTASGESRPIGWTKLACGDFDGDGLDEVVLMYREHSNDRINLSIYNVNAAFDLSQISALQDESCVVSTALGSFESFDLQVVDLDFDGTDEIIIAGSNTNNGYRQPYVKVYDVTGVDASTIIVPREKTYVPTTVGTNQPMTIALTTGDFNGDYVSEIALAYGIMISNNSGGDDDTFVHLFRVADDTVNTQGATDYLEKLLLLPQSFATTKSVNSFATLDIDAGDMNGDGHDDFVLATGSDIEAFFVDSNFGFSSQNGVSTYTNAEGTEYDSYLTVTDMNNDGKAEIVNMRNWLYDDGNGGNPLQRFSLTVHKWNGSAFELLAGNNTLLEADSYTSGDQRQFSLCVGDFDGDEVSFGNFNHYVMQDVIQPIIILNAPPTHSDNIGASGWTDVNAVFAGDGSVSCDPSTATYDQSNDNTVTVQTTVKDAWDVSATAGVDVDVLVASVSASITATYGESYSNSELHSTTYTEQTTRTTCYDDAFYASVTDYDVYEYPLYAGDSLLAYVLSIHPIETHFQWLNSKDPSANGYLPSHEPGNIFSYRKKSSSVPIIGAGHSFSNHAYNVPLTGSDSWLVTTTQTTESTAETTNTVSVEASAEASVYGVSFGVSGSYSLENTSTHTISVGSSTALGTTVNGTFSDFAKGYDVNSVLFWGNSGGLTLDYEVHATGSFYTNNYSTQDPALNLPWRLDPQRGLLLNDPADIYRSKSFFLSKANPQPGDTIRVGVRVYNYSLIDMTEPVEVSFFLGNPLWNGVLQQSMSGQTVFTVNPIASQTYQTIAFDWIVPSDNTLIGRMYAQLDPNGSLTEIHEENNIGFISLGVYFPNQTETGVSEFGGSITSEIKCYPNPADDHCTLAFNAPQSGFYTLEVIDLQGRKVLNLPSTFINQGFTEKRISLDGLTSGIYVINIVSKQNVVTGKLVVN